MTTFVTWNVNSLRARKEGVLAWLASREPDVVALQETRVPDSQFPYRELEALGYHAVHHGDRGYAGVALLAREPIIDSYVGFRDEHDDDSHPRLLRATVGDVRVVTVYVPTRKAIGKVAWLDRLRDDLLAHENPVAPLLLLGDFNICFDLRDVWNVNILGESENFPNRVEDRAFRRLLQECGLTDLYRRQHPDGREYSWFDYRRGALARGQGMRLDYVFGSQPLAERTTAAWHDLEARAMERASDHAPVWIRTARLDQEASMA